MMRIHFRSLPSWRAVLLCLAVVSPASAFDDEKPADKPAADKPGADKPAAEAKSRSKDKDDEYYELMKTFVDTFDQIERSYVKDVNRRQLLEAALKGMIKELDPYSSYIAPDEVARFNQEVEQEFGGIGIQVSIDPRNKRLTVMTPLPGTPAYRGGVRAGDIVM
jgi:C-terminal processing protease CtpA/Prc